MLRQACAQVRLELAEEAEVTQPVLLPEQQVDALGEGRARAKIGASLLADSLRVGDGAEPSEGGVESALVEPEASGGGGARAAGGAERVQELVVLAPVERTPQAVVVEERVEMGLGRRRIPRGAPPRLDLRQDRRASAPVAAEHPLEDGAPLVAAQLVERRRRRGRLRGRGDDAVARAVDHDGRGALLLALASAPRGRRRRRRRGGSDGLVRLFPRVLRATLALSGRVRGRAARHVGEGVRSERRRGRRIGEERPRGEELVPGER
ncbi:hypothetical protein [Anaeromyxobacter sp. Fw109-5]|uniref:hypothetical protein n=1 Tax=Anaeromyxobacter sp. (strain Fw109-5) TaxID=404589 RepID=UPI00059D523E|nr:hypothetical protein [Anaeromyxobacter sp. Fw109-5]